MTGFTLQSVVKYIIKGFTQVMVVVDTAVQGCMFDSLQTQWTRTFDRAHSTALHPAQASTPCFTNVSFQTAAALDVHHHSDVAVLLH